MNLLVKIVQLKLRILCLLFVGTTFTNKSGNLLNAFIYYFQSSENTIEGRNFSIVLILKIYLFHNNMCIFEEFEFHSKYIDILGNPIDMFVFGLFLKEVVWIEDLSHFLVLNPVFAIKKY